MSKAHQREILRELADWAETEQKVALNQAAENVWKDVEAWAEGCAQRRKIDLRRTGLERIERQGRIFNFKPGS